MSILSNIIDAIWSAVGKRPLSSAELDAALDNLAIKNPERLNWRTSIVDLMKLTNQDSSLSHRERLAQELGYTWPLDGSADMNVWLKERVMQKLASSLKQ